MEPLGCFGELWKVLSGSGRLCSGRFWEALRDSERLWEKLWEALGGSGRLWRLWLAGWRWLEGSLEADPWPLGVS